MDQSPLKACPSCGGKVNGLVLFPMNFLEVDRARKAAASLKSAKRNRNRKRKGSMSSDGPAPKVTKVSFDQDAAEGASKDGSSVQRRTGRWTNEEVAFCDKLMEKFRMGQLPVVEKVKMNELLGNMLLSKQSRLTKKMKNAKLSSQTYQRSTGFIADHAEARLFSQLEESFFKAIQCQQEQAEIRFHMQKEWREMFTSICVKFGQPLDADAWLNSVEEMDRRNAMVKDAARIARRKLMTGMALNHDSKNIPEGVFIEQTHADRALTAQSVTAAANLGSLEELATIDNDELLALLGDTVCADVTGDAPDDIHIKSSSLHGSPFLGKVLGYLQRHGVPFEHVDAWVPSFVSADGADGSEQLCRLCFAGSATTDTQIPENNGHAIKINAENRFHFHAFGDYSQKFSFDIGCGLPGRVYQAGIPTWEQSVQNAPLNYFERSGGAKQWGIKTVLGIAIPSPNVGRIVLVLYSRHNREKDQELVGKLQDEFTKLMPSPKWKLVVDMSPAPPPVPLGTPTMTSETEHDAIQSSVPAAAPTQDCSMDVKINEIISILGEQMPSPQSSSIVDVSSFMSLRLMLLRDSRTAAEEELVSTIIGSYSSYKASGRSSADIGVMLARDYTFLSQLNEQPSGMATPTQISFLASAPADDFLYKNSPTLTPIETSIDPPVNPLSENTPDMVSVVSN